MRPAGAAVAESGAAFPLAVPALTVRSVGGKIPLSLPASRLRVLVTGGAGFVGSHLVDVLMGRGYNVIVVDNFFTGRKENVAHHMGSPNFELIRHDVVEPIMLEVDQIYHLACPASPVHYKYNPVKTIKTNVMGTLNMLGLARRVKARFLLTSTSEVYGDPLQHPQKEEYWGNVNPIGERSCYDEGKRTAETLTFDYHRQEGVEVRVARIFNTYGPRMNLDDGRVVSNFVSQALKGEAMTIHGDGTQTRSFQYVSDLVDGLVKLMEGEHEGPFNIGNPGEFTMNELAEVVKSVIDPGATVQYVANTPDDPSRRRPDITKAKKLLGWEPTVALKDGLPRMVEDFKTRLGLAGPVGTKGKGAAPASVTKDAATKGKAGVKEGKVGKEDKKVEPSPVGKDAAAASKEATPDNLKKPVAGVMTAKDAPKAAVAATASPDKPMVAANAAVEGDAVEEEGDAEGGDAADDAVAAEADAAATPPK